MKLTSLRLCALAALVALGGCGLDGPCLNDVVQTIASPSGANMAVVFTRNCGATTGSNTQVSIVPADQGTLEDDGNVLIADGNIPLVLTWSSDNSLKVAGNLNPQVFKKETSVAGIAIAYDK